MMKLRLAVGLLPVLCMLIACDRTTPVGEDSVEPGAPSDGVESVGFSPASLDALNRGIQALVDDRRVAGMVTMLARHGTIVQSEAFGFQDLDADIPMRSDTIFRIYSMTKPITGVAMMILYERGLWNLDEPVAKYVPEFEGLEVAEEALDGEIRRVPAVHSMTMRELMTHTGGLTYGLFSESAVDTLYQQANVLDPNSSLQAMIDKLARIPLRQQPGSLWHYSVSVDVQGFIIERLSGKSLPEFFADEIFGPLGMRDTAFYLTEDQQPRLAKQVYEYGPEGRLVQSAGLMGDYSRMPGLPSGGGGLVSTASDYMRFTQMLLNGGRLDGVRILSPETVELMRMNHAPTTTANAAVQLPPGTGFGLDVAVTLDPDAAQSPVGEGTYWWAGAGGTWFWIDPENDLTFVAMAQHEFFSIVDLQSVTQRLVYDALIDPAR